MISSIVGSGLLLLKERVTSQFSRWVCDALYYLLPNLENFNLKHQAPPR